MAGEFFAQVLLMDDNVQVLGSTCRRGAKLVKLRC